MTLVSNPWATTFDLPPSHGFPPSPTAPCVFIPKVREERQVRMSIIIRAANFQVSSAQSYPRHAPPAHRGKPRCHPGSLGRGPPELTYFESPRAPPVTAATGVARVPERGGGRFADWLLPLSFTARLHADRASRQFGGTARAPPRPRPLTAQRGGFSGEAEISWLRL